MGDEGWVWNDELWYLGKYEKNTEEQGQQKFKADDRAVKAAKNKERLAPGNTPSAADYSKLEKITKKDLLGMHEIGNLSVYGAALMESLKGNKLLPATPTSYSSDSDDLEDQ